jgi:hypothetical protein
MFLASALGEDLARPSALESDFLIRTDVVHFSSA